MAGKKPLLDDPEWKAFSAAVKRLPPPIPDFSDGAACPWCGAMHRTVTYGENTCDECRRSFLFGYPPWHEAKGGPCSWVEFPHREFEALGRRPELIAQWVPNERQKHMHFQMIEERLGKHADKGSPQ